MAGCFVNFTNHPSDRWDKNQKVEALKYGEIIDVPFPDVKADQGEEYVQELTEKCLGEILGKRPNAVLCQGEFTLAFQVATALLNRNIPVFAACSRRQVKEDGFKKEIIFEFVRFRQYQK